MRTGFESTLLGIELGTLEVKGEWSDHYTTEASVTTEAISRAVCKRGSSIEGKITGYPHFIFTGQQPSLSIVAPVSLRSAICALSEMMSEIVQTTFFCTVCGDKNLFTSFQSASRNAGGGSFTSRNGSCSCK